jgi:hypothetical protein
MLIILNMLQISVDDTYHQDVEEDLTEVSATTHKKVAMAAATGSPNPPCGASVLLSG